MGTFIKKWFCLFLSVCLAVTLCACKEGKAPLVEDVLFIGDTYVRVCYLDTGEKKPVILVGHGLGGDSAMMMSTGRQLADAGFFVLVPDLPSHGQTQDNTPDCLIEVILAASRQYDRLLDAFSDHPNADTARVGVTGFSMGAMTAFYYAANGRHPVTAIAPCCGTPDFTELTGQSVAYLHCPTTDSFEEGSYADEARQEEIDALLASASPLCKLQGLDDLQVFMQNGDEDAYFPLDGVRYLADRGKNCSLKVLSGQGHIYTQDMCQSLVSFFVSVFL